MDKENKKEPKDKPEESEDEDETLENCPAGAADPEKKKKKKNKKKKKAGEAGAATGEGTTQPTPAPATTTQQTVEKKEQPEGPTTDATPKADGAPGEDGAEKKKKKKKKKAKKADEMGDKDDDEDEGSDKEVDPFPLPYSKKNVKTIRFQDNSPIVNLKSWQEGPTTQTNPPIRTIDEQFKPDHWKIPGVTMEYIKIPGKNNEDAEKKDFLWEERLTNLRKSAEVHRQVRKYAQTIARPGIKMIDLCQKLESTLRYIMQKNGLEGGQAFPTGCSLNHVAAHYTPNYGDNTVLRKIIA